MWIPIRFAAFRIVVPSGTLTAMPLIVRFGMPPRPLKTGSRTGISASAMCRSNSSRNFPMNDWAGIAAASASAQMVRPAMLPQMSRTSSTSPGRPSPASILPTISLSHPVPSRHGVHCPHDSCA